ncbi:hypothetical protein Ptr902_07595 [Pyrenophora tritici-repentis]|nr:hypothetical protein Ptr902_07595 [Pyrenophora tritici-repentis]
MLLCQYGEPQVPERWPHAKEKLTVKKLARRTTITREKCEVALILLLDRIKRLAKQPEIFTIAKVKFWSEQHRVTHCAWLIASQDRQGFFFDPTGVQFGADWGLLTPWETYVQKNGIMKEDGQHHLTDLRWYSLGSNKDSVSAEENARR